MAEKTLKERVNQRLSALKNLRTPYEAEWREIAKYAQPSRSRFLNDEKNKNFKRTNNAIYNSHAIQSFRTLTGGMTSGLSSPSRPWFRLGLVDEDMADDHDVKTWLSEVEGIMYDVLANTNYYGALKSGYAELGMFGTEACLMEDHWSEIAVCHNMTAGEYWIGLSDASVADTLYRRTPLSVHQVVQSFGLSGASEYVRTAYDNGKYDDVVNVMHAIEPNTDRVAGVMTAKGKPWRSVYWDENDGNPDRVLKLGGYEEQPFWAPRWDTTGGDTYGTSPGFDALPDMRELQLQTKRKTQATAFLISPEKIVPATVKLTGEANRSVTASQVDAQAVTIPYQMPYQSIDAIMQDMQRCTRAVDDLTFANIFMSITEREGVQPLNDAEVASRNEEKYTQLGPVIERVNKEKLGVSLNRAWGIMERKRMFPTAPEALQGRPVKFGYVSLLAQMQRQVGIGQIERAVSFIGNLSAQFPAAGDRLDIDQIVEEYNDRLGTPPKILRSIKDAEAMRQQRAQDEQNAKMAAMAQPAQQGADAARLLSEAAQNGGGIPGMMSA